MIFVSIIWPPAYKLADQICNDISVKFLIEKTHDYALSKKVINRLVETCYMPDKTPKKRIKTKLRVMNKYDPAIRIVYIFVANPTICPHKKERLKGYFYCREMKGLKKYLRQKYSPNIVGYVYDVIIHVSDDEKKGNNIIKFLNCI